ncbi:unnamed protein product [Protopolystoma xenopodis]|uniref:Uncharacterized protein n=1 Tax=Protopolystoma xenopodis TaxID=117903 RepID=A0A3S5ATW3_9PLAT|nr:unnamed protein product [Protopolystoma xenopodis]
MNTITPFYKTGNKCSPTTKASQLPKSLWCDYRPPPVSILEKKHNRSGTADAALEVRYKTCLECEFSYSFARLHREGYVSDS